MWLTFLEAFLFGTVILYAPGFLILKAVRLRSIVSITCAPVISIFGIAILGLLYAAVGIPSSWSTICLPLLAIGVISAGSLFLRKDRPLPHKRTEAKISRFGLCCSIESDWACLFVYIFVAVLSAILFFILPLDGADSFGQDADNTWHLSLIRSFVDSGNYSILDATLYHDIDTDSFSLLPIDGGFYPAIWHCIGALIYSFIGVSIPLCANAANALLLILVFPCGMYILLKELSCRNYLLLWAGSAIIMAFGAFPWTILLPTTGPLYPFFAGMALLPTLLYTFIRATGTNGSRLQRFRTVALFLVSSIAVAGSHTSVIFTAVIILLPYCIYSLYCQVGHRLNKRTYKNVTAIAACCIFALLFALLWLALFNAPFLYATTHFVWPTSTDSAQACMDIVFVAYGHPFAQVLLSGLVIAGIIYTLHTKRLLWITFSYMLACIMYLVCVSTDGLLKSILTGFWYTDAHRVAAMAAFLGIILATFGLYCAVCFIKRLVASTATKESASFYGKALITFFIGFFLIFNFYPDYAIPGRGEISTSFGNIILSMAESHDSKRPNLLSPEESDFVKKVSDIVDPEYLIYNNADDGSSFAYSNDGLNLTYRRSSVLSEMNQSSDNIALQEHIDEIGTNETIKQIATENRIKYILILDQGGEITPERHFYGYYDESMWSGLNAITDETAGLRLLLSEGDMRLYEIED